MIMTHVQSTSDGCVTRGYFQNI